MYLNEEINHGLDFLMREFPENPGIFCSVKIFFEERFTGGGEREFIE